MVVGEHDVSKELETVLAEDRLRLAGYKIHHGYRKDRHNNDICLLKLARHVNLNIYTPVCLARSEDTDTFYGKLAWAYGEILSEGGGTGELSLQVGATQRAGVPWPPASSTCL